MKLDTPNASQTRHDPWIEAAVYEQQPQLAGAINATDVVYRNRVTGRCIKVRTKRAENPSGQFGTVVVEISGAHCDPETGRAKRRADAGEDAAEARAFQIAPAFKATFKPGANTEAFMAGLEFQRLVVAAAAERAVEAEEFIAALPG